MNYENFKDQLKVTTTTEDFDRVINNHRDEIIAAAEAAKFADGSSYYMEDIAIDIAYPLYETELCNELQRIRLNDSAWDGDTLYDLQEDRDYFMYRVLDLLKEVLL